MTRLIILCADDTVWALPCWIRTIPKLKDSGFTIAGLATTSYSPSIGRSDTPAYLWYISRFGLWNFLKMVGFALVSRMASILHGNPQSFKKLASFHSIPFHAFGSVKDLDMLSYFQNESPDVVAIMVPEIIPVALIEASRFGMINQHPSLLPRNKGLFPYIYAFTKQEQQGVTLHSIDQRIDEGEILYQYKLDSHQASSMVQAHYEIMHAFPEALICALDGLVNPSARNVFTASSKEPTYNRAPNEKVMKSFFDSGGRIIGLEDLIRAWRNGSGSE
ncbi:formyltransferase family protein [uncultured Hoeflea sp.]|uniref:formyltransferase family protein n=1 Tax=uncultured Hoeflea sp. TaxID=538666 RepID=UPI00261DDB97|nr:formyltransferase family protein [uncultured Hoeflea sp.]